MRFLRSTAVGFAALSLVLLVAGGPRSSLSPAAARGATGASVGCSWAGEADERDVNIGAPDLNAEYWYGALDNAGGGQIEITGTYPHGRYFSFTTYTASQNAETSIYDRQIVPDKGSYNPFVRRGRPGQPSRYTIRVLWKNPPPHPAPNTLYTGPATGQNTTTLMILRIYLPIGTVSGGVPYPQIHVLTASGVQEFTEGACSTTPPSFGAWYWKDQAADSMPPGTSTPADGTTSTPTWTRSFSNGFGNQQNSYLQVLVSHHWGQIVVAHFKAPTFPDTSAGQPPYTPADLRYWSVCTYDSSGTAVFGCVPDYRLPQRNGWVTLVVSDPDHRPSNATSADGAAWLPWSPNNEIQIMERNLVPSPAFSGASERITTPADNAHAAEIMGPYYPTSAYCSEQSFLKGGWKACLPALARQLATCPAAGGALHGTRLGPIALGEARTKLRRRNPRLRVTSNRRFDDLCLAGGPGIRVGYLHGKAVLALTANRFYGYQGLRPGATVRVAKRLLGGRLRGPLVLGRSRWYEVVLHKSVLILKVRARRVQRIGIAERGSAASRGRLRGLILKLGGQ